MTGCSGEATEDKVGGLEVACGIKDGPNADGGKVGGGRDRTSVIGGGGTFKGGRPDGTAAAVPGGGTFIGGRVMGAIAGDIFGVLNNVVRLLSLILVLGKVLDVLTMPDLLPAPSGGTALKPISGGGVVGGPAARGILGGGIEWE